MNCSYRYGLTAILFFMLFANLAYSQGRTPSRSELVMHDRIAFIGNLHDSISSPDRRLVNGELYFPHQGNARNHPFYKDETWSKGSVTIEGHTYTDQLLRYDLFLDQPVMLYVHNGANAISLNREFVNGFEIFEDHFTWLTPGDSTGGKSLPDGFYHELYAGKLKLLVRWSKSRVHNEGFRPDEFQLNKDIIVVKNGIYYTVKNDRTLRKVLGSNQQEVRKFMKSNNIHVALSTPESIAEIVKYYESIQIPVQ